MDQPASSKPAVTPLPHPYSSSVEKTETDEAETIQGLIDSMRRITSTVKQDSGHAERGVHAKSHAVLKGTLHVPDALPATLKQGLFARGGTYPVMIRFSTAPGDILNDKVSTPRGIAIKVLGVEGTRLAGSEGASTQDFLLVDGPAFLAPDLKTFLKNMKPLAATTDRAPGTKQALSAVLRGAEKVIEAFGGESGKLKAMGGHALTNPLGSTFHTQAPIRFGEYIAKLSLAPLSESLKALADAKLDDDDAPDAIRAAISDYFATQSAEWTLRAQLCRDLDQTPVEDASVPWPEEISPHEAIATLRVEAQQAWSPARVKVVDEQLSFSPWHGIEAHRPLGSIMRARKVVYDAISQYRARANSVQIIEPQSLDQIPD